MTVNWFKKRRRAKNLQKIEKDNNVNPEKLLVNEKLFSNDDVITVEYSKNNVSKKRFIKEKKPSAEQPLKGEKKDISPVNSYGIRPSKESMGVLAKLRKGLVKTRETLAISLDVLLKDKRRIDDEVLQGLEELLISSDLGVDTTMNLIDKLSNKKVLVRNSKDLKSALKEELIGYLDIKTPFCDSVTNPVIVMVVGVNGVGKTSTIGKLAKLESLKGNKVLIAAADTFRAAATEQISVYAKRSGADLIISSANADPAAVAYDSVDAAISRGVDKVFIDTAGRLHTKINLMGELKKIGRSVAKRLSGAPHEIFLVLDATTGQNAISQAKKFDASLGITGVILTKLDSSAKGGVAVNICHMLNVPIRYVGVGEGIEDLQEFNPERFVDAML